MDLPFNIEAEKQVLANMLFSNDVLVNTMARLETEDFYDSANRIIFETIKSLFDDKDTKVDQYSLIDKLSLDGNLERVGDAKYIFDLVSAYNDYNSANYYINSVLERSLLRKILKESERIANKWQEDSKGDIASYINLIEQNILKITRQRKVDDFIPMDIAVKQFTAKLTALRNGDKSLNGLLTSYGNYNRFMGGFKNGEITILAARPSVGKSAFALNFLCGVAERTEKPCALFSLEMGIDSLTNRILALKSGVKLNHLSSGRLNSDELRDLSKAMKDISEQKIFLDQTAGIKVSEIRSKLNNLKTQYGELGLVVVDYIGLVASETKSRGGDINRSLELGHISAAFMGLAKDFNCPFLILSQLNRGVEEKGVLREPKLSDLRESGSLEQDASVVLFIHRDDYQKQKVLAEESENTEQVVDDEDSSNVKLIVAKNRNGQTGEFKFQFKKAIGRFVETVDDNYY